MISANYQPKTWWVGAIAAKLLTVAAFLGLTGCARPDPLVSRPLQDVELTALRQETRRLAIEPCGSCHQSSLSTAKPAALAIFDLDDAEEDWARRMTGPQLNIFLARIHGDLDDPTRKRVRSYLEAELARRDPPAGATSQPSRCPDP